MPSLTGRTLLVSFYSNLSILTFVSYEKTAKYSLPPPKDFNRFIPISLENR